MIRWRECAWAWIVGRVSASSLSAFRFLNRGSRPMIRYSEPAAGNFSIDLAPRRLDIHAVTQAQTIPATNPAACPSAATGPPSHAASAAGVP
jgi:hypothetical protein